MKQKVTLPVLIISGVVLLLVLIFFGWKTATAGGPAEDVKTIDARIAAKDAKWKGH